VSGEVRLGGGAALPAPRPLRHACAALPLFNMVAPWPTVASCLARPRARPHTTISLTLPRAASTLTLWTCSRHRRGAEGGVRVGCGFGAREWEWEWEGGKE
jgi:hypothetical protein